MKWLIVLGFVYMGSVLSEIDTNVPVLQDLKTNLNLSALNISVPDISGLNLPINVSKVPTLEDAERIMQEKCQKNGGAGAYERAMAAKNEAQACVESLVNVTELNEEMEKAKPTGDLDIVFKKYCKKSPIFQGCITNFTNAVEPCLESEEKESKRIIQNITTSLLNFICYNEGDRIALFIAEGGPECLQSKKEAIQDCINQTAGSYINTDAPLSPATLPHLVLNEKECGDMRKIQRCVVRVLEGCEEPTPSNIVGSLFDYVWQMTPCNSMQQAGLRADEPASGSGSSTVTASTILVPALFVAVRSRLH